MFDINKKLSGNYHKIAKFSKLYLTVQANFENGTNPILHAILMIRAIRYGRWTDPKCRKVSLLIIFKLLLCVYYQYFFLKKSMKQNTCMSLWPCSVIYLVGKTN